MFENVSRRDVFRTAGAAVLAGSVAQLSLSQPAGKPRVGLIGVGHRGRSLLGALLATDLATVPAICDISLQSIGQAEGLFVKGGFKKPEVYSRDEQSYKQLLNREDLDAVLIATPWHWHTPMAVEAMRARKYVGVEVPAALSIEECWQLVDTSEQTGIPCMMLENWSFRRDNLAVLNMIRQGLLGDILHCHCAHSHNTIDRWFFDENGKPLWPAEYLYNVNRDQYPTHSLGPVLSWMNLNCGDYFDYVTSTATRAAGVNHYFAKNFGRDHPLAKRPVTQGDIVTTVVKTKNGNTIVINYDMQLPRPYDNRWMIQGTEGVYKEQYSPADDGVVYLAGRTDHWPSTEGRDYETWKPFGPYQREFDHSWWKAIDAAQTSTSREHNGTDSLELIRFLDSVRNKIQTPIDVYDSVLFSVIVPLSGQSIAVGSAPVKCPDFTRGKWRTKKPSFALEA